MMHQRKARSASKNQNECSSVCPWSNHCCTSGTLVVIGKCDVPMPSSSHGRLRGPSSKAAPCAE